MNNDSPQPQELFGIPLTDISQVHILGEWWQIHRREGLFPVIARGNLAFMGDRHLDARASKVVAPLKEVRGVQWK